MKQYLILVYRLLHASAAQCSGSSLHENTAVDTNCIFCFLLVFQEENDRLITVLGHVILYEQCF